MRKKLFTLLLAVAASVGTMFAEPVQIGDLYYNLDATNQTAEVAYQSGSYSGEIIIPSSVTYNSVSYSVTSIESSAFRGCSGLTSVTIPNSVTNIGEEAFYGCSGLTSVTIPNSVTSIGEEAFRDCTGLTSVTIPNSVTSIGDWTFAGCSGLTSVTIGNGVTSIGRWAFNGCTGLTSPVYNAHVFAFMPTSYSGAYTIPDGIESIAGGAFYNCTGLTSVTIPNSVTNIGHAAFSGCKGLTSVTIPNSVTNIKGRAFITCENLKSVTIGNNVSCIGDSAFYNCSKLSSINIPSSVTCIGDLTFYGCSSLPVIDNLRYADTYLVDAVDKTLPTYTIKEGTRWIGGCNFFKCAITSLIIPNSVTSIGWYAFVGCSSLKTITIGSSVTSIGEEAFYGCSVLDSIIMLSATPPTIGYYGFRQSSDAVVYVPFGSQKSYLTAEYWKDMNIHSPVISQEIVTSATACSITFSVEKTKLQSIGIEGGEQIQGNVLEYIGLEPSSEYNDVPVVLTANTGETETVNVSFTTSSLELTTKASKPVSSTTAILLAETNMSDAEVNCGFEYKRNDAPDDMAGTKVFCPVASGQMAGRLKNLRDDTYYKYRAFYQSAAGNMYYGDWQYIFAGDVAVEFDPILYTYGATVVKENEATISGYALAGSEDFTEQGFEYWAESRANSGANALRRMPAALNEHFFVQASGIALHATLTNLDAGTVYKYRVYGKVGDQYYYGSEQAFTTTGTYTPPTYTITFANWDGATLQSSQVEEGTLPEYTGATPERPEDEQYTYSFDGWTPTIVIASADATYTATYTATPKSQGIEDVQGNNVQCTKIVHNGQIYILRGDKTYTTDGRLVR